MNRYPVAVYAHRDPPPGRWLWLVKWLLLVPHYLVLAVLWVAFVAVTVVAYVAVLFTGRYPHAIFTFNVGVLRWSWRVGYYGGQVLGTDRYPPFTLADVPDYPAGLDIDYPPAIPRWRPLMAWLLAIPHLLLVGALTAGGSWQLSDPDTGNVTVSLPGLVGVAVLVVGVALLFTGRYPRGLYDLLVGVARWQLRVIAYIALLLPAYPPFRLDQGEHEPDHDPTTPPGPTGTTMAPSPGSAAGSVMALVAGVLALLTGLGLGAAATGILLLDATRDADGYLASRTQRLASPTAAVTAEQIDLRSGDPGDAWPRGITGPGDVRITATSPTGGPLFVGIARSSDVDSWLVGTARDEVVAAFGDDPSRYRRTPGSVRAAGTPAEQTFWLASATGTGTVVLDWSPVGGEFTVVLANADGTPAVTADVRVALRVPDLTAFGTGLLVAGGLLTLVALALIYLGATGLGRRHTPPGPPTPPGPATTPLTNPPASAAVPQPNTRTNVLTGADHG